MKSLIGSAKILFVAAALIAPAHFIASNAAAQSSYFTSRGCVDCHAAPTAATCNGCHKHGNSSLRASANKSSYAPGETVTVTLSGGERSGWIGARLYNQSGVEIARPTGNQSGMGGSTTFPAVLSAPAPTAAGSYTWKMAYFGNMNGTGTGDVHSEQALNVTFTVVAAGDTTAPAVSAFTLPATSASLTVPVSSLTATDNVGVTGYLVNKSATAPAASATGWTATAPASVTAVAGSNTFYAWAKDAAGNVSASRSATVVVTLPDTTVPTVSAFTLPATSTSLTVPVSSLTATDNVGVTGYIVTATATAPAAGATGWTAAAPASVTAVAGSNTFYAWAKDAAGNVSASRSASVTVTIPSSIPSLVVSTLADGSYTHDQTLNVSGTATDPDGIQSVTVNGQPAEVAADGSFATAVALQAGSNTIVVVATDKTGAIKSESRSVTYDATAPVLTVSAPADNTTTAQSMATISGTVNESSTVSVAVNGGSPSYASISGSTFTATVYLAAGVNTIDITATDLAGNVSSAKRTITLDAVSGFTLAVTYPSQDITTSNRSLTLKGKITDALSRVSVKVSMNGRSYSPRVYRGEFQQRLYFRNAGVYAITVTAKDASGNTSTVTRNVIYRASDSDDRERDDD